MTNTTLLLKRQQLAVWQNNLLRFETQAAQYGIMVPAGLQSEIENAKTNITRLQHDIDLLTADGPSPSGLSDENVYYDLITMLIAIVQRVDDSEKLAQKLSRAIARLEWSQSPPLKIELIRFLSIGIFVALVIALLIPIVSAKIFSDLFVGILIVGLVILVGTLLWLLSRFLLRQHMDG